jgi:adenosylcobinamide-GDP ribazoletransferase
MEVLRQLVAAFMLLTRLPVWRLKLAMPRSQTASVWAYPVVGGVVGVIGAGVFAVCNLAGLQPLPSAVITLTAQLFATGALHEDGLADLADGFGGGRDRQRKLEIMRDSNIGTFGALALGLSMLLRVSAIAGLADPTLWLIAIGTLSRTAMLGLLATTKPARRDGIAASLHTLPKLAVAVGMGIGVASALILPHPIVAIMACAAVTLGLRWLCLRQIDGQTGDVLGACAVLAECALWCA